MDTGRPGGWDWTKDVLVSLFNLQDCHPNNIFNNISSSLSILCHHKIFRRVSPKLLWGFHQLKRLARKVYKFIHSLLKQWTIGTKKRDICCANLLIYESFSPRFPWKLGFLIVTRVAKKKGADVERLWQLPLLSVLIKVGKLRGNGGIWNLFLI